MQAAKSACISADYSFFACDDNFISNFVLSLQNFRINFRKSSSSRQSAKVCCSFRMSDVGLSVFGGLTAWFSVSVDNNKVKLWC